LNRKARHNRTEKHVTLGGGHTLCPLRSWEANGTAQSANFSDLEVMRNWHSYQS